MGDKTIFISYSRQKDSGFALKLVEELRQIRADVWIDQLNIPAGTLWDIEIEKALKTSAYVLFIASAESVRSQNVIDEVSYALRVQKPVIPIIISDCNVPYRFDRIQQISFIKDYNSGFNQLLKTLGLDKQRDNHLEQYDKESTNAQRRSKRGKTEKEPKSISGKKASLTGFTYDIFISYAYSDTTEAGYKESEYIEQFYKDLKILLNLRIGFTNSLRFWRDDRKMRGDRLDYSTVEALNNSAMLICLISSSYVTSAYCRQQLKLFYEKAQKESLGSTIRDQSRIIAVVLNNVPSSTWPYELNATTKLNFHDDGDKENAGYGFNIKDPRYKNQLTVLTYDIYNLLNSFRKFRL